MSCVILACIYAMTDSAGMDPYHLVGLAVRLAMDLKLYLDEPAGTQSEREMRKRLFWSVYSMDQCSMPSLVRVPLLADTKSPSP